SDVCSSDLSWGSRARRWWRRSGAWGCRLRPRHQLGVEPAHRFFHLALLEERADPEAGRGEADEGGAHAREHGQEALEVREGRVDAGAHGGDGSHAFAEVKVRAQSLPQALLQLREGVYIFTRSHDRAGPSQP